MQPEPSFPAVATNVFDPPDLPLRHKKTPFDNANTENWVWPEKDRDGWKRTPDSWKEFYTHWRTATDCPSLRDPDSPHLSLEPLRPEVDLPLGFPKTIFVRSYYLDLCKTTFLPYLLVRLLQQRQIVLFTLDGDDVYLFYDGEVHTGSTKRTLTLPWCKTLNMPIFIWSLFDIALKREPPKTLLQGRPIQTASPDSSRYEIWTKRASVLTPHIVVMPVWSRDELERALRYQFRCQHLQDALTEAYPRGPSPPSHSPEQVLEHFPGIFELINKSRFDPTMRKDRLPVENAITWLLDTVIGYFGFIARDVFMGIVDFEAVITRHNDAISSGYGRLETLIAAVITQNHNDPIPHHLVCIHPPDKNGLKKTRFKLKWKSNWIMMEIVERLITPKDVDLRQKITRFQNTLRPFCPPESQSSSLIDSIQRFDQYT